MEKKINNREKEKQELSVIMMCLMVICGACVFIALLRALLFSMGEEALPWPQPLPDLVTLGIMAACCVLIYRMLHHVRHGQVFVRRNAHLIIWVGVLVEVNGILQQVCHYFIPTEGVDSQVYMIYILLGVFFLFIGCLFKLAVYIKEEQELTI